MKLERARELMADLFSFLGPSCQRISEAGSVRRRKAEVKDLEIICIPKIEAAGGDHPGQGLLFEEAKQVDLLDQTIERLIKAEVLAKRFGRSGNPVYGKKNKLLIYLGSGECVDVFSTTEENWWVTLFVRTGPKELNMEVAKRAKAMGWRFEAYGSGFLMPDGTRTRCHSEQGIFAAVNMPYQEPWDRGA